MLTTSTSATATITVPTTTTRLLRLRLIHPNSPSIQLIPIALITLSQPRTIRAVAHIRIPREQTPQTLLIGIIRQIPHVELHVRLARAVERCASVGSACSARTGFVDADCADSSSVAAATQAAALCSTT